MASEVIVIAATAAEENAIERVLDDAGIAYEVRIDPIEGSSAACFLGCGYAVDEQLVERARELLRHAGVTVPGRK